MENIIWMLLNPLIQSIVIVSRHKQDKQVNPLNLLFDFYGILIDDLPSKCESNENGDHGDS